MGLSYSLKHCCLECCFSEHWPFLWHGQPRVQWPRKQTCLNEQDTDMREGGSNVFKSFLSTLKSLPSLNMKKHPKKTVWNQEKHPKDVSPLHLSCCHGFHGFDSEGFFSDLLYCRDEPFRWFWIGRSFASNVAQIPSRLMSSQSKMLTEPHQLEVTEVRPWAGQPGSFVLQWLWSSVGARCSLARVLLWHPGVHLLPVTELIRSSVHAEVWYSPPLLLAPPTVRQEGLCRTHCFSYFLTISWKRYWAV